MKLKHVFTSLGLALTMALGVGVALLGRREAKIAPAQATGEDKMFGLVVDLDEATGYAGFEADSVGVEYYDASGSTIDKFASMHLLAGNCYTVNIPYVSASENINTIRVEFKQSGAVKKSLATSINPSAGNVHMFKYSNTWSGDNWTLANTYKYGKPRIQVNGTEVSQEFSVNMSDLSFRATIELSQSDFESMTYTQIVYSDWSLGAIRQSSVNAYCDDFTLNRFKFKAPGKYDIIAYNGYEDGGIFEIKQWQDADSRYIYYVLENNTPTNDYIYTWGGSEQFGAWPGTKITSVVGVQEVTNNGVLHFQGSETPKLIYKIPVTVGYPTGDSQFKFNNNDTMQTAARPINGHSAYWWSGDPNSDAGYSIDLLVEIEALRNAAENTSVCNIKKADAISVVNTYLSLGTYMQETYIDCTTVLTHRRDKQPGEELVSYKAVIEELAKIAEIDLNASKTMNTETKINNSALVVTIIAVIATTVAITCTFLIVRRRKEQ